MADSSGRTFQPDSDVHITYEDQQKINHFARYNAKFEDHKTELKSKENELRNLEDALEELILLDDDSTKLPYLNGDVFVYKTATETSEALKKAQSDVEKQMKLLQSAMQELKTKMSELKAQLYGKFGSHINLEGDEE